MHNLASSDPVKFSERSENWHLDNLPASNTQKIAKPQIIPDSDRLKDKLLFGLTLISLVLAIFLTERFERTIIINENVGGQNNGNF